MAETLATAFDARRIHTIMVSLVVTMFIGSVEQAIVSPALHAMGLAFHAPGAVSWIVTGYLLCATPGTLIAGAVSDIWGRRATLIVSLAIFILGSVLCAAAGSMAMLVAGRMVQGCGGGGLLAVPNTIIADLVAPRERGKYQVYISGTYAFAGLCGPIAGGYFANTLSWRGVFWVFVPLAALAVLAAGRSLHGLPPPKAKRRFDGWGAALLSAVMVCLLLAVHALGAGAWPRLALLLALSAGLGFAFIRWETSQRDPLLPVAILGSRIASATSAVGSCVMAVNASLAAYLPLYYETRFGFSMSAAGLVLTLPLVGIVAGAYGAGQYMRLTGRYKLPPVAGSMISGAAYLGLAAGGAALRPEIYGLTLLAGVGAGSCLPPMLVALQNSVPRQLMGVATALQMCFRSVGGMMGVAIFGLAVLAPKPGAWGFELFFTGSAAVLALAALISALLLPERPFRAMAAVLEEAD